jgi:hypothetical protein
MILIYKSQKKIYHLRVTEYGEAVDSYDFHHADGEDVDRCGDSLHPLLLPHQCTLGKWHGEIKEIKLEVGISWEKCALVVFWKRNDTLQMLNSWMLMGKKSYEFSSLLFTVTSTNGL